MSNLQIDIIKVNFFWIIFFSKIFLYRVANKEIKMLFFWKKSKFVAELTTKDWSLPQKLDVFFFFFRPIVVKLRIYENYTTKKKNSKKCLLSLKFNKGTNSLDPSQFGVLISNIFVLFAIDHRSKQPGKNFPPFANTISQDICIW